MILIITLPPLNPQLLQLPPWPKDELDVWRALGEMVFVKTQKMCSDDSSIIPKIPWMPSP